MCGGTVDIQSVTAEIRRKKRRKKQDKNIMSASATHGGHKQPLDLSGNYDGTILFFSGWNSVGGRLCATPDPLTSDCGPAHGVVS